MPVCVYVDAYMCVYVHVCIAGYKRCDSAGLIQLFSDRTIRLTGQQGLGIPTYLYPQN